MPQPSQSRSRLTSDLVRARTISEHQQKYQHDSEKLDLCVGFSDRRADFAKLSEKSKRVQKRLDISIKKLAADNPKAEKKLCLIVQTAFHRNLVHNLSAGHTHQYRVLIVLPPP